MSIWAILFIVVISICIIVGLIQILSYWGDSERHNN